MKGSEVVNMEVPTLRSIRLSKNMDVQVVAEEIGARYVVPTDIAMVYGILGKGA